MSKYEDKVIKLLQSGGFYIEREKIFSDLHGKKPLRFDICLSNNNVIICLIEVDGEQHWKKIWGNDTKFKHQQENDRIKNSYCLAHNIPLYRVPYWEINNLTNYGQIFDPKFRVRSKWHNDNLTHP